jgi:hypothetical protein
MQEWFAYVVSILLFVLPVFAQNASTASGSIRGDVFAKGTNGKLADLPGVLIVLHGAITKETESDAKGAFAVNGLPPGTNCFEDDPEIFLTEDDRKWLKAMDCAFGRKVHHA